MTPDFARKPASVWPAFSHALRDENIGALFAFPLTFGTLEIGAIDLYSVDPMTLSPQQQDQTTHLTEIVSRIILRNAVNQTNTTETLTPFSRRTIHQATGMMLAQLGIQADDAYLLLQARAFAEDRPMQDVARDVVERRLRFGKDSEPTQEAP